jgi:type I restriction enzyme S subunit
MNFKLEEISLQEAVEFIVDNRGKSAPTVEKGIKLIATNCISNANLYPSYDQVRFVSLKTYKNWFRSHPQPWDIILTNKGSQNGAICLVPDPVDFCIAQDMVALRANRAKIDPLYLFAALRSSLVQSRIKNLNVDAVIPHFKKTDFDKLLIPLPARHIQKKIGELYYEMCLKIELNRRMNETLEAMARAIFKDWFVDFGPTRAKQEGLPAYLPEHLWSLFPSAIDPETGLPEGWESSRLEEFMELAYGKSLTAKNRLPGDVVVYGSGGETGFHNEALISSPAVIVGRKGTVGSIYWEDRPIFPIDTVFYVVPKKTSLLFCYQLLLTQPLANMNTDAAVPGLNRNNAYRLEFPSPDSDSLNAYELITSLIWAQRGINIKEARTLAEMRDRLLPKLMSGEIRVKEAEKMVGEVL